MKHTAISFMNLKIKKLQLQINDIKNIMELEKSTTFTATPENSRIVKITIPKNTEINKPTFES